MSGQGDDAPVVEEISSALTLEPEASRREAIQFVDLILQKWFPDSGRTGLNSARKSAQKNLGGELLTTVWFCLWMGERLHSLSRAISDSEVFIQMIQGDDGMEA